ncbi:MAG: hypothetical protein NZO16_02755 [Deltaproteobacteria bacterium]|nr:hypothetical protein [Deltaproteobacteria bacterium]
MIKLSQSEVNQKLEQVEALLSHFREMVIQQLAANKGHRSAEILRVVGSSEHRISACGEIIFDPETSYELNQNRISVPAPPSFLLYPVAQDINTGDYHCGFFWLRNGVKLLGIYKSVSFNCGPSDFEVYHDFYELVRTEASKEDLSCASAHSEKKDNLKALIRLITSDEYRSYVEWGNARPGHPEGSVKAHIEILETNLEKLADMFTHENLIKLLLLIHSHDTFKKIAMRGVSIEDPQSHSSLAARYLEELGASVDVVRICQYHDLPFAKFRKERKGKKGSVELLDFMLDPNKCPNPDLYMGFVTIDNCVPGKSVEFIHWFFDLAERVDRIQPSFSKQIKERLFRRD